MPVKLSPGITAVKAGKKPLTLQVTWKNGDQHVIDVSSYINKFVVFRPLRDNPARFAKVKVGDYGHSIAWSRSIDMSAYSLWRLAEEQSGATMNARKFHDWRRRQEFTLESAAKALGLSRRMVAYYDQGVKPIPRVVALAAKALEAGL
jgi:hypothetical protein